MLQKNPNSMVKEIIKDWIEGNYNEMILELRKLATLGKMIRGEKSWN